MNFGYALINLITRYLNQTVPIEDGIRHAGCAQLVFDDHFLTMDGKVLSIRFFYI